MCLVDLHAGIRTHVAMTVNRTWLDALEGQENADMRAFRDKDVFSFRFRL